MSVVHAPQPRGQSDLSTPSTLSVPCVHVVAYYPSWQYPAVLHLPIGRISDILAFNAKEGSLHIIKGPRHLSNPWG